MKQTLFLLLLVFICSTQAPNQANSWDKFGEQLPIATQEERAKALFKEIRCVVCSG